jgi:hypothetical protein
MLVITVGANRMPQATHAVSAQNCLGRRGALIWTADADDRLKSLLDGGMSLRALAKAFGVGRQAIHQRAIKCGLVKPSEAGLFPPSKISKLEISLVDLAREALPAGHPASWDLINQGTCLEGNAYSEPDAGRLRRLADTDGSAR